MEDIKTINLNNIPIQDDYISTNSNFIISSNNLPKESNTTIPQYPFVLEGFAFVICTQGKARLKVNLNEYDISKGYITTVIPLFITELVDKSADFAMKYLAFSNDLIADIPKNKNLNIAKSILLRPCIKLDCEEFNNLIDYHAFILKQCERTEYVLKKEQNRHLIRSFITEISAIYIKHNTKRDGMFKKSNQEDILYRFFHILLENHNKERTLSFYADKLSITPKYLSMIVKSITGKTACDWINETVISSAKFMLKTSSMSVNEIAEELNFPNSSFFCQFFKKHTNITPLRYRLH